MDALETTPNRPTNEPGVYRHEASGKEMIVMPDAQSTAQQDALVHMGFTRIAPPPSRAELLARQEDQAKADAAPKSAPVESVAPVSTPAPITESQPTMKQETAPQVEPQTEVESINPDDFTRKELVAEAIKLGIKDAESDRLFPNKQTLADAITAAKKGN